MPIKKPGGEKDFGEIELGHEPAEILDTPETQEKKESTENSDAKEHKELKESMEVIDMDDTTAAISGHVAGSMKKDTQEEKIRKLLLVAKEKGVVWAVNVAKKMDDPYMLDLLHDALAKEGFYKKFKP